MVVDLGANLPPLAEEEEVELLLPLGVSVILNLRLVIIIINHHRPLGVNPPLAVVSAAALEEWVQVQDLEIALQVVWVVVVDLASQVAVGSVVEAE